MQVKVEAMDGPARLDLRTLEDQAKLVEAFLLPAAVGNFERDGCIVPSSFVFATHLPDGNFVERPQVVMTRHVGMDKDTTRAVQQALVDELGGVGIVFITEGWGVTLPDSPFVDLSKPVSEHPDRREVVMVTLSHRDGVRMWQAPVIREGSRARLGDFASSPPMELRGLFTGYFGGQKPEVEA